MPRYVHVNQETRGRGHDSPTNRLDSFVSPTGADQDQDENRSLIRSDGFEKGLQPEKVLGAIEAENGTVYFCMKWKGTRVVDFVPAKEANVKCPQLVIQFYERCIKWET